MAITHSPGTLAASNETSTTVDLSWGSASGSGSISYLVYYLASNAVGDMDTIAECQTVGTLFGSATSATSTTITGLTVGTDYVFNVIPLENGLSEAGIIYTSITTTTTSTPAAPVPGGGDSDLYISALGSTGVTLNWTAATDDATPPASLLYTVYYSTSNNIDSTTDMVANGTVAAGPTAGITSSSFEGLNPDTTYYMNVLVSDGSNDSAYDALKTKTPASATLKDEYLEGTTGLSDKMAAVFVAGETFVSTTNRAAILADLKAAASSGKSSFTSTHLTSFETANLRLKGTHMDTYFAGIVKAFADENIYSYEVTPTLDDSDTSETSVILTFSL
jgi:hypothetical protein